MTVSTIREAGNALVVDPDSDPDFAGDLSQISLDLSSRANTLIGTTRERFDLPASKKWIGLEFYEPDYDAKYRWTKDGWQQVGAQRRWSWSAFRDPSVRGTDDAKAGQFTQICALDIPNPPNGAFLVHVTGSWFTAEDVSSIGYSRVVVGQRQLGPDQAMTLTPAGTSLSRVVEIDQWYDGFMQLRLLVNPAQATGRFFNAGLGLTAQYLGPNY